MLTLSNCLSFIRAPLALLFLQSNVILRMLAIILAMVTDSIDGFIARKSGSVSRFGAILDPAMDKFFVYFVLATLFAEDKIHLWEAFAMISRDFFLAIYWVYLKVSGKWATYKIHAIRWGKVTTAMQFAVLGALTLSYFLPWYAYVIFIVFGALAFLELIQTDIKKN